MGRMNGIRYLNATAPLGSLKFGNRKQMNSRGDIGPPWKPRMARYDDVTALEKLIPLSARALQAKHYSARQIEAALGPVFGVDHQLIRDGTFFVVERSGAILGCGGWSKRESRYGGSVGQSDPGPELNPICDAARIRAFFVDPAWARRGIGRSIMAKCESAAAEAGFARIEIVATLAGEPLYASFGYLAIERFEIPLPGDLHLPAVRMTKILSEKELHGA